MSLDFLSTLLCEIEAVINSRPITFVSDEVGEVEPLTPAHFIIGERLITPSAFQSPEELSVLLQLDRMFEHRMKILGDFWARWSKEYLLSLQCYRSQTSGDKIQVGDVVLIAEDSVRRHLWPVGIVQEALNGRDVLVRSVKVRSNGKVFRRPIKKLYRLEAGDNSNMVTADQPREQNITTRSGRRVIPPSRPDL